MTTLQGNTALVTGASSSRDIGTAICRKLASQGADIFFTYWKSEQDWSEKFCTEIQTSGVKCKCMEIDLSDENAAYQILDRVSLELGVPSILINNAAHSTRDGYLNLNVKILDDHYAVNMRTTFLLAVEFARRFKKVGYQTGRIVNMTSGQDLGAMPGELAYAATKGAISAFTRSLAAELAALGITVNAINPGPTDSTWMTDGIRDHLLPKFPMGRIGLPEDVAHLIGFLVSAEGKWITGQIIHSEGGFVRG